MKKYFLLLCFLFLGTLPAQAAIKEVVVQYQSGDVALKGLLIYDDSWTEAQKHPAVLVFSEWKGLNDYAKGRARQIAELGYVAFAADMYGNGVVAQSHDEAAKLFATIRDDRKLMRDRANAAVEAVKKNPLVDANRIAAIGYCSGGTAVLELARGGYDLKGVVSFHGGLSGPVPAEPGMVKARVLVFHGGSDKFISSEEEEKFKEEMKAANANLEFHVMPGAVHAFTIFEAGNDPSTGRAYNAEADEQSWNRMEGFLQEVFL